MKYATLALLLALPVVAQEPKPEPDSTPSGVTKFIELKHLSGERLNRVVGLTQQLHRIRIISDPVLRTFAIQGDTPARVAVVEEFIRRFDIPAAESRTRQIQLTLYMLEAADDSSPGKQMPPELGAVIDQLRIAFGHRNFRLIETTIMRGSEGSASEVRGLLPVGNGSEAIRTNYAAKADKIFFDEAQKAVRVTRFEFYIRIPVEFKGQTNFADSVIKTDLTIKEDQKLVIGKITKDQNEGSGFLVVTAKVE